MFVEDLEGLILVVLAGDIGAEVTEAVKLLFYLLCRRLDV